MNKLDLTTLVLKHDAAIVELEKSSAQMMIIWRCVGALALVTIGVLLTSLFAGVMV